MYVRASSPPLLRPEPVLIFVLFVQKREQRCMYFQTFPRCACICSFACSLHILFADIIRLLLMVPIYAWISLASYLFWVRTLYFRVRTLVDTRYKISQDNATPLLLIRDAYEAIILTAFFYLLLMYLSPDPEAQKAIFRKHGLSREADADRKRRGLPRKKWVFPLGFVRWKPQVGRKFCCHFLCPC